MCVLAFAVGADSRWPLVLAGNRDERHDRPTEPLHHWPEAPQVLAGKDLSAGGAWLGVSELGWLATVTNLRRTGPPEPHRASRGWLVRDILAGHGAYADPSTLALDAFNPFNLVRLSAREANFWSNGDTTAPSALGAGVHGLGNGPIDEPIARVERVTAALRDWIQGPAEDLGLLFPVLQDSSALTGAPVFLRNPTFGTRCSTIVRVGADGAGQIVERRYDATGSVTGETALGFTWSGPPQQGAQ